MKKSADILVTKGLEIPYYHFLYEGDFYKYLRIRNNKYLGDGSRINEYFLNNTFEQYDLDDTFIAFQRAMMIIIHYFKDYNERDLDNNSYKPVIDAIKKTGIIKDDAWYNLSLMFLGNQNENEKIETIIIPHEYLSDFILSGGISSIKNLFEKPLKTSITTNKEMLEGKQYF